MVDLINMALMFSSGETGRRAHNAKSASAHEIQPEQISKANLIQMYASVCSKLTG